MGCSPRIQQIVGKGKRGAAEYIKTSRSPEILNEILDRILSPDTPINDRESIDWIRWLIAGGNTPETFATMVKKYHNASICGLVWTAHSIAYRCRTCSLSPCMSLCAKCFGDGKHDGHDYNMFRSQTGGACDCGDSSVMQCSGFCSKHGTSDESKNMLPPPDLLYIAELMAPRIFCRLILHLRSHYCLSLMNDSKQNMGIDADEFLTMLYELNDMGAAMMRVLTSALTNSEQYRKFTRDWSRDDSGFAAYMATVDRLYHEGLKSSTNPEPPTEFKNCPGLQIDLVHKTFLEELVFWTVKYEFPQKLINFLLIMLPDAKYKETLMETFVLHYSRISMVLEQTADPESLSKRVAKVSVQWFSNKELAVKMTENLCLLQVMVVTLRNMISKISVAATGSSASSEATKSVVDCKSSVIRQYRYWLFVSDLNSVLSYKPVAEKFMNDESLVKMWFSFLSYFQGMNVNQRRYDMLTEDEPDTDPVFLAELWNSSPIMPLLLHLKDKTTVHLTKNILHACLAALKLWLESSTEDEMVGDSVSFHIPLHRSLAIFTSHAVTTQQIFPTEVIPSDTNLIRRILSHPLRIQAAYHEIGSGLWKKNGIEIKKQAVTYTQSDFCTLMVDADLYFLQILGCELRPNEFMISAIDQFKVKKWFLLDKKVEKDSLTEYNNSEDSMIEGFLQFWATLCVNRTNLGNSSRQNTRMELVTLLCLADRAHSQLIELLPERPGVGKSSDFDIILAEVADYSPPNLKYGANMKQGLYTPKACVWNDLYDPIHVMLRAGMNRKDFQNTTDRFTDYLRKIKQLPSTGVPWPPYRIPVDCEPYTDPCNMLNGRVFHALVWVILYKYVHQNSVSENILSLTIYLLELTANIEVKKMNEPEQEPVERIDVMESNLEDWFVSDRLAENVGIVIQKVSCASSSSSHANHRVIEANESIISLLLKCHSKLGGREFFVSENCNLPALANRIGDGPAFIEKVLVRIVLLGKICRTMVRNCLEQLHPKLPSNSSKLEGPRKEHAEKKRKAEEHRRHIMESLAKQRERFAKENENLLLLGEDKMEWQSCETPESSAESPSSDKYYCVICHKLLPSTKENPLVLLAQVQASNLLGHRKTTDGQSFAERKRSEMSEFRKTFSDWADAVTLDWEDGVNVQSCGHVFHHRCSALVKTEEYSCPVCRQSANNVIPILPSDYMNPSAHLKLVNDSRQATPDISSYLKRIIIAPAKDSSELLENIVKTSLQRMRKCLNAAKLSRFNMSEQSSYSMLFLASVARCNLEMELMWRGGSLVKPSQPGVGLVTKKSCIAPLLRLLGVSVHKLNRMAALNTWQKLIGEVTTSRKLSEKRNREKCAPLLLRDPITMLLHLMLILLPNLPLEYYFSVVKILYTLVNFQSALRLSYQMTEEQRNSFRLISSERNNKRFYRDVMRVTLEILETMPTRTFGRGMKSQAEQLEPTLEIRYSCLPFLRMASILRSHIYYDELPEVLCAEVEIDILLDYLKLKNERSLAESTFIRTWFAEFRGFVTMGNRSLVAAQTLLSEDLNISWGQPKLLPLPYEYKDVFQTYQQKPCSVCHQVCEKISICLVCNTLVCLQEKCCERGGVYEAVRHASNCGAGTGVYLTVSTSNVIIIRGPKACIWGSIYLDVYGEEDRNLTRGRPLYLSSERYRLLEHEWLSLDFNRRDNSWIPHKDQL